MSLHYPLGDNVIFDMIRVNELPEEFLYDPVSKTYGDPSRRPGTEPTSKDDITGMYKVPHSPPLGGGEKFVKFFGEEFLVVKRER